MLSRALVSDSGRGCCWKVLFTYPANGRGQQRIEQRRVWSLGDQSNCTSHLHTRGLHALKTVDPVEG